MSPLDERRVDYQVEGDVIVLTVLDEQLRDAVKVYELKDKMLSLVEGAPVKNVVIDLHCVRFIGSIGFLAFLAIRRLEKIEKIVLCNVDSNILEIFQLSRLVSRNGCSPSTFAVASTLPQAIADCQGV